jgi:hypothetical protein
VETTQARELSCTSSSKITSRQGVVPYFSKHVRSRANSLINLLPIPHIYQNVLKAIAYIDWRQEAVIELCRIDGDAAHHQSIRKAKQIVADYQTYLQLASVDSEQSAIVYLDWLEPKMRRWLLRYEQMLNCHHQELKMLEADFR